MPPFSILIGSRAVFRRLIPRFCSIRLNAPILLLHIFHAMAGIDDFLHGADCGAH